jgi:hypothetical protein
MDIDPKIVKRIAWEPENDRPGQMKAFDEIVTGPLQSVHIERMHDGCYWIALYLDGDIRQTVVISAKNPAAKILGLTEAK